MRLNAGCPRVQRGALRAHGITTLAELTLRIPRRKQWWKIIPKLGQDSAKQIEVFFVEHPALTERARALIRSTSPSIVVPWENVHRRMKPMGHLGFFAHHAKAAHWMRTTITTHSQTASTFPCDSRSAWSPTDFSSRQFASHVTSIDLHSDEVERARQFGMLSKRVSTCRRGSDGIRLAG